MTLAEGPKHSAGTRALLERMTAEAQLAECLGGPVQQDGAKGRKPLQRSPAPLWRRVKRPGCMWFGAMLLSLCGWQGCHRRQHEAVITIIPKSTSTDTSKRIRAGEIEVARQFGYRVNWVAPQAETDYAQQAALVLKAVEQHASGVMLVPDHQLVLAASVHRAKQAGVPVILLNAPISLPPEDYAAFVGSNDRQIGILAADRIGHLLNGSGEVGIIGVSPVLAGSTNRERAFAERLHMQFPKITVVGTEYGLSDWARSTTATQDLLRQHPQVRALFASDGFSTMGMIAALRKRSPKEHVVLIGVDQEVYVMDALRDGTLDGVVATDWLALGQISMQVMHALLSGQPYAKHTELPVEMITADDMRQPWIQRYLLPQVMSASADEPR